MTIKSVNAPAISVEGIQRLKAACSPKRLTSASTLFDAGYEQAKIDFLEKLRAEYGGETKEEPGGEPVLLNVDPAEQRARRDLSTGKRWWHR